MSKVNKSHGAKGANKNGGSSPSDADLLKMQETEQKKQERITMLTNILSMRHQAKMSIINNMKA